MKLIKLFSIFALLFIASACNNEEAIIPQENSNNQYDTKVTIEEAEQELLQILEVVDKARSRSAIRSISNAYSTRFGATASRSEDTTALFHVFNFEDEQGFAIMAADERLPSLYALADAGSLNMLDSIVNPGVEMFIDNATTQATYMLRDDLTIYMYTEDETDIYGSWGDPIVYQQDNHCPVRWGQDDIYNAFCPKEDDVNCKTGCVATAVAQLMAFYEYPESYNSYSFDWDAMTAYKYAENCTLSGQEGVGLLMYFLGTSNNLDMDYGVNGSAAYTEDACRTFTHFGYSNSGTYAPYNQNNVVNELIDGYPLLLNGTDSISGVGHCWLAHGVLSRKRTVKTIQYSKLLRTRFEYCWYVLCNWGWEGLADGYYLSNVFDPTQGASYGINTTTSNPQNAHTGTNDCNFKYDICTLIGIRK